MKTAVITGAMGFIGHNLTKLFLEKKWRVMMIDDLSLHKDLYITKYRMESIQSEHCEFINTSCHNTYDITNKMRDNNANVIIHLASIPNQKTASEMPQIAVSSIVANTLNMASIADSLNIRIVHASSSMAYGNFTSFPQIEDAILRPINLYGTLKAHSEDIIKLISKNYMIIRPSAVYGNGDSFDRVIAKWILLALENKDITVHDASSMLDFTHVNDLIKGIFAAATSTHYQNETYNITRGQARSLGEAALIVKEMTKSKSHIVYSESEADCPVRGSLDISKARRELNYQPRVDIQDGIESYINWVRNYVN